MLAFAFQIYGDFSGYTNIARGSALLFGVELSRNFRFPYFASGPSDFWTRWHITLSTWFRDYVYIPLGGNRCGNARTLCHLLLTMLVAGLWHGAGLMFVLWGLFHGLLLILYRLLPPLQKLESSTTLPGRILAMLCMFTATLFGWLLFRSADWQDFHSMLLALATWKTGGLESLGGYGWLLFHCLPLLILQLITWKHQDETSLEDQPLWTRCLIYLVLFLAVATSATGDQEFIYFQF
ncbi:MAG: MBOAT family protein [Blastochloris sp.]|nr:MBOAT family protein [Blastochloris sp.]